MVSSTKYNSKMIKFVFKVLDTIQCMVSSKESIFQKIITNLELDMDTNCLKIKMDEKMIQKQKESSFYDDDFLLL